MLSSARQTTAPAPAAAAPPPRAAASARSLGTLEDECTCPITMQPMTDPVVAVKSFNTIGKSVNGEAGTESAMAKYVGATGPLSICVDAQSWQTYKSGILSKCSTRIDHCVQAVGIDTGKGVWKVRNSWNTNWGEDGFIRLKYGQNSCGLTNDPTWVSVVDAAKKTVEEAKA